jgi:glycosyltransferase involved in cell wall biosynthesis
MIRSVVHFIDTVAFSGAENALLHLLRGLDRRCWRPVLFHHDEPGLRPLLEGADAVGVERRALDPMRGLGGVVAVPSFARALRAERPDVFHAHLNWPLACSGGILAAALSGIPAIVATVHLFSDFPSAATIPLQRLLVTRSVRRYLGVSRAVSRDIEQRLHVPRSRIRSVPNGIALEDFDPGPGPDPAVRRQMTARVDLPLALTLARLDGQKGLTHLIRATALVPEVAFVIAGDGSDRKALESEARTLGVSERVSFIGFRTDTSALLANADLFVLPSLIEGLPLSVLEAMASARPVIATAAGGTAEVVHDRVTGLLVSPGDPNALAIAIRELVDNPSFATQLARAGRELVRREFSSAATARSVMDVYDELLAGRRGARG